MIQRSSADNESHRLAMLASLHLDRRRDPSLDALAAVAADLAEVDIGLVCLIERERIAVVGASGFSATEIDRWDSFCDHALLDPSRTLWVEDARRDPRFSNSRYVASSPHARFYAGSPLRVNGCMLGTLCVISDRPRAFDPDLVRRLERIATACAAELAERHRTGAMRQALLASADALIDCDADGRICEWSDGAEDLFGFARHEALGAEITLIIPEEHRPGHRDGMRRWRSSGAARLGRRLELPAVRKDGSALDIELWMSVSHDNGQACVHANIRDISERRRQARELKQAMTRAEDANRAKTAFLANMSHELRTPLNGVTACAGLLAASALDPEQTRLTDIISGAADQLGRLISDLLDLSRIESGELKLDLAAVDLGQLVEGLAELSRLKADEKGIALRLNIADDARQTVLLDPARVKQVLGNLLSNAVKFTEEGEVCLSVSRRGDRYRFGVADTGIGFDAAKRGLIFERFQQADPTITRRFGGTGLGLAICRDLVTAMGGTLECRSHPNQGSEFWFEIDLASATLSTVPAASAPCASALAGLRVLVVDDNATNRQVAGLILESAEISVSFAETGLQALSALSRTTFDLVLMDMMMPEMDGVEATRCLRAGQAGSTARDVPIIMLTANTLPEHIDQSLAAGADGHLAKPITPSALLDCILQAVTPARPAPRNEVAVG